MTLYRKTVTTRVRILKINGSSSIKRILMTFGIYTGDAVQIKRPGRFGGPVLIERNGAEVALGREIAECILVEDET